MRKVSEEKGKGPKNDTIKQEDHMRRKSILCVIMAMVMLFGTALTGCKKKPQEPIDTAYTVTFDIGSGAIAAGVTPPDSQKVEPGGKAVEPVIGYWDGHTFEGWYNGKTEWDFGEDTVEENITLSAEWKVVPTADVAEAYEQNLTWGEANHLYVHYLRGAHSEAEQGKVNSAEKPGYSTQIESDVYKDWGLWVWESYPTNSEGRAFYPMKIDESGAVYDIDLKATYNDGGWNSETKDNKGLSLSYSAAKTMGIQVYSQDSRINGHGFWVNDGGDVLVKLEEAKREKGDYHWFVMQGKVGYGSAKFTDYIVYDPYEGLEPGSAVSTYDVVSNKGNNDVYTQQRVAEGWENNSVGYQIFMASFADGNGDGMGDIQGIIQKLDYLEELGVDTLWLTPFQQSNSYHGYDIMDYFTVDPRFGTLDDYRELVYEAHNKGMKVLMDFVLNHTSTNNPWFEKSQKLVKETVKMPDGSYKVIDYRNFYNWTNEDSVPKTGLASKQWFKDANGYYYYSSFGSSMPELNFDYQGTRDAILQVALYWMSFGLDGFRLDAVKHIYMENENPNHSANIVKDISASGDYSFDMSKDAHFFMEFNAKLKASYPNAILVGENFNGDPIKIAGLYEGLDSQFNFNWYYDTTGCLGTIAQSTGTTQYQYAAKAMNQYAATQFDFSLYRKDYIDGVFTSNHDVQRARDRVLNCWNNDANDWKGDGAKTEQDVELSGELAKLWAGMCMTVPGITWIYNGDELGMFGTKKDNAPGEGTGHEDRWYRQAMKWTKNFADDKANCKYEIGFNNYVMTWDELNEKLDGVKEQKADEHSIYNAYKKLIEIRKANKALRRGKVTNLTQPFQGGTGDTAIVYSVSDGTNEFYVYVNASTREVCPYRAPQGTRIYSTSGKEASSSGNIPALTLEIYKVK